MISSVTPRSTAASGWLQRAPHADRHRLGHEDDHSICVRMTYRAFTHATCGDLSGTDAGDRTDVGSVVAPACHVISCDGGVEPP